jgi:DNA-binding transcriptional LysR family regulator
VELRELRAFVAVVEEGGLSPAARRLHLSQPALSQTVRALERELGVDLLIRSSTGVRATDAGLTLLGEARALLARHDQAVAAVTRHAGGGGLIRLGVPLELPATLLPRVLTELADAHPDTRVQARHLSTTAQLTALQNGDIDIALTRERPAGPDFDAVLVVEERLGVLLSTSRAELIAEPGGVRLESLAGLEWVGFPRSGSPTWYDQITAVLHGHGLDLGRAAPDDQSLIAEVKLAAVQGGRSFTLAPPDWSQPIPGGVTWCPLIGSPLTRRTWAVWPANSRRRDLGFLVAALEDCAQTEPGS